MVTARDSFPSVPPAQISLGMSGVSTEVMLANQRKWLRDYQQRASHVSTRVNGMLEEHGKSESPSLYPCR